MIFRRLFHTSLVVPFHSAPKLLSNQSLLATLRKKTGYSIGNCKKALETCGNDLAKAESWLNSQAQSQGWAKAAKLQNRATQNGLVGIAFDNRKAIIVEVNCETDFVARNEKFQSLVAQVAETCLSNIPAVGSGSSLLQVKFSSEQLGVLKASGSDKSLADVLALNIGQIGENMSLRRAVALYALDANTKLACCTHPLTTMGDTFLGKYGAVVAYTESPAPPAEPESSEPTELPEGVTLDKLPRQLCQHIIGMNPLSIERIEKTPAEGGGSEPTEGSQPLDGESKPNEVPPAKEDGESVLVEQDFVANPEYRVGEVLDMVGWKVQGFLRLECGDSQE